MAWCQTYAHRENRVAYGTRFRRGWCHENAREPNAEPPAASSSSAAPEAGLDTRWRQDSELTVLDLSNDAGLCAIGLLTLNVLLGLLLSVKYNPVRRWPHRRINTVRLHNWTGYTALAVSFLHPVILLFVTSAKFHVVDLLWPLDAPKQPLVNTLGACSFWLLLFVVTTSILWQERRALSRRLWKRLHLLTYALFPLFAIHGLLTDPALKDQPLDPLDGEKVFVELCIVCVTVAMGFRIRHQLRQPPPRIHRPRRSPVLGGDL